MHARHRLECDCRRLGGAAVVAVDAQPVHLAAGEHLLLADHRDVVLRLAGGDAGLTPDAGIEVDRHRPGRARIRHLGIERLSRLWPFQKTWVVAKPGQCALAHQVAAGDAVVSLHRGEPEVVAGLGDAVRHLHERRGRVAQRCGVAPDADRKPSLAPPEPERQRDAIGGLAGHYEDRRQNMPAIGGDVDAVFGLHAEARGGRRCDQARRCPRSGE